MMEEIRFRHDSREYQTLFQPTCTTLYYVYIYIYNLFCSLDFHDQKRWMNFINLKLLLTFPLVNDSKFLWQIPLRFPNAPVMWIPETRKAYHQQTPEVGCFVRVGMDFWPEKSRRKKTTGTSPI